MGDISRVLIVDDDEDELLLLEGSLSEYETFSAEAISSALALAKQFKFDVALLDVRLGKESGLDLARQLRDIDPDMAIVIHTGYPESYLDMLEEFDGYIMKGSDERHLRSILENAVHLHRLSPEERLRRNSLFLQLDPACKDSISNFHTEQTACGSLGISERFLGWWKTCGSMVAWVIYWLGHQVKNRFTVGVASCVGCGRGCRFCLHGTVPQRRRLKVVEILDQFLLALGSPIAQIIFREPESAEVWLNFTCEGEPMVNLANVAGAIRKLAEVIKPKFRFIITSIGLEEQLRVFLDRHIDLPRVKHYWSVNSFREVVRHWLMPATLKHNLIAVRDLYIEIARKTGEKVTASFILIPGLNDLDEDVEAIVRMIGNHPEFLIKLQPFVGAPDFAPFPTATDEQLKAFRDKLIAAGIDPERIRIRHVIGGDAYGGCGTTLPGKYRDRMLPPISCKEAEK